MLCSTVECTVQAFLIDVCQSCQMTLLKVWWISGNCSWLMSEKRRFMLWVQP